MAIYECERDKSVVRVRARAVVFCASCSAITLIQLCREGDLGFDGDSDFSFLVVEEFFLWFLFWCGEGTKMRGRELVVLRKAAAVAQGCVRALDGSLRQPPPSKMLSYCRPGIRSLSTGYGAEIWRSDDSGKGYEGESRRSLWNSRSRSMTLVAAGAFSLSFAASMMSVASAKERVDDKYAPREVVLYQYDACPFCNKVKGTVFWHRKPFFIHIFVPPHL